MKLKLPKKEEGGDPTQVRKPIQTSDPNDPRIKKYQDSLRNYNWTNKQISGLTKEGWDRNKSISIEEQVKAYGEPQDPKSATPSSYSVFKKKNNYGADNIDYIGNYTMPVQPYQYVAPQNVQQTPGKSTQQSATKSTIYTSNPDDPRLKAYQDSLNNYNWSNSNGRNKGFNTLFPDDAAKLKSQSDYKNWSFTNNNTKEQPQYYVYDAAGKPEGNGAGATRDYYAQYPDPQQPYAYKKPIPELKRSQIQGPQSATPGVGQIGVPTGGPGPMAGGPTNFSFTGRNDQGQQDTRYFSDLDTWKAATDQMGYRWRNETNNGQQANASGYQFKLGGMTRKDLGGGYSPVGTPLAQVAQPPNTMNMVPHIGPIGQSGQPNGDPNNPGTPINWDHVLASYVTGNLAQGLTSRLSPNSQQNTTQQFNRQQFGPMNFLPYTPNNSVQAQYGTQGMQKGGLVKKDYGGFSSDMSENMRKWILDDDSPQPTEEPEEQVQPQQQSPEYDDAQQFAMFAQMFGLDAADGEREPEQQDQGYMKKGGWMKGAVDPKHKGYCTPMTKSTCTGHRRAFAETMKKHHGFHEMGGLTGDTLYSAGQELDVTPEQYKQMLDQGYEFE